MDAEMKISPPLLQLAAQYYQDMGASTYKQSETLEHRQMIGFVPELGSSHCSQSEPESNG